MNKSRIQIVPLTSFGLGIYFPDFQSDSALAYAELRRLLHQHGIVLLDRQATEPSSYTALAESLGVLEMTYPPPHRLPGSPYIRLQSNRPNVGVSGGGMYWHADSAWYDPPAVATLLLCQEAPATGGETSFVDMRAVLNALPNDLRAKIESLEGWYPCRATMEKEYQVMGLPISENLREVRDFRRPLVRKHPVTSEAALYLNEKWLDCIHGLQDDESKSILDALYSAVASSPCHYRHSWKEGQILIWDNNVVAHKALCSSKDCYKTTWRLIVERFHPPGGPDKPREIRAN